MRLFFTYHTNKTHLCSPTIVCLSSHQRGPRSRPLFTINEHTHLNTQNNNGERSKASLPVGEQHGGSNTVHACEPEKLCKCPHVISTEHRINRTHLNTHIRNKAWRVKAMLTVKEQHGCTRRINVPALNTLSARCTLTRRPSHQTEKKRTPKACQPKFIRKQTRVTNARA